MPVITLLTDFGTSDSYVAEVKGVLEPGDIGQPALIAVPDSAAAKALRAIAEKVAKLVAPTATISLTN